MRNFNHGSNCKQKLNPNCPEQYSNKQFYSIFPEKVQYANAYVPFQQTTTLFDKEEALCKGTIFHELYQPYKKKERF